MVTKTTGILNVGLLVILTMPLLYKRVVYWHALLALSCLIAVVGASPLLTNWIQYGSPFYPSMTFNPDVPIVDITSDFIGNADALSMGYLARICYAWVSPDLTVAAIRLFRGDSDFSPAFTYYACKGLGLWFNVFLLTGAVLLAVARKNVVTWLCLVVFVTSNFVPLKYIGHARYFPQIWMVFPLAMMNFVYALDDRVVDSKLKRMRKAVVLALAIALVGLVGISFSGVSSLFVKHLLVERFKQDLIASVPREIKVDESFYRYTLVQRFRQAGVKMTKATDGKTDTVAGTRDEDSLYRLMNMPRKDPITSRLALPSRNAETEQGRKEPMLPCLDLRLGLRFAFRPDMTFECVDGEEGKFANRVKFLLAERKWRAAFDLMPHVLWD